MQIYKPAVLVNHRDSRDDSADIDENSNASLFVLRKKGPVAWFLEANYKEKIVPISLNRHESEAIGRYQFSSRL